MKAIVCGGELKGTYSNINDLWVFANGKSKDWSKEREEGCCVPRKELDNQPKLPGYAGPMWDGDCIRYETWKINDILSR
jgi:hypothetical protein